MHNVWLVLTAEWEEHVLKPVDQPPQGALAASEFAVLMVAPCDRHFVDLRISLSVFFGEFARGSSSMIFQIADLTFPAEGILSR